ncbi:hypothetical protein [Microbacterium sp. APC 3901]|uniref:hypothetical protein n=1 Tax=Microbacterium sp. APC 3901 TaxID=3035192 RepID=UPI0025B3AB0E|nr:hypothetical protein [Microbacterium sp. APC 3901]MDN3443168.1 hypothetical protein [Microbacterium sp. APC 3901]
MTTRPDDRSAAFAAALRAAISERGVTLAHLQSQLKDDGNRFIERTGDFHRNPRLTHYREVR